LRTRIGPLSPAWRGSVPYVNNGYLVTNSRNKTAPIAVHRRVWEAAHGPIPAGHVVHHLNGIKTDNRLKNLTLLTSAEHSQLHHRGERNTKARLTEEQVKEIRRRYADGGVTQSELARAYGLSNSGMHGVLSGKNWRHVA
jgi:hypothetical protein